MLAKITTLSTDDEIKSEKLMENIFLKFNFHLKTVVQLPTKAGW